jgi:hypothetical protein
MPFYYCPRSSISKMVSNSRSRTTREEEANETTIGGQEEEIESEGEVYKKQKTSEPYTYLP